MATELVTLLANDTDTILTTLYPDRSMSNSLSNLPSLSAGNYATITVILLGSFLVGLVVNPLVIHLFMKDKQLHSLSNRYVIALSSSDLLMTVLGMPFPGISSAYGRWVFGDEACVWHGFTLTFLGLANLNLLTAIAVDRYVVIVRPDLRPHMTSRSVKWAIFLCFTVAFLWAAMPLMGFSSYVYEGAGISCSLDWTSEKMADQIYIGLIFSVSFLLPVVIICTSYSRIYMTVRHLNANNLVTLGQRNAQLERRMVRTFILVCAGFLVSWTPYAVVSLIAVSGFGHTLSPLVETIPAIIAKISVVWNPFLYVGSNRVFYQHFLLMYFPSYLDHATAPSGMTVGARTLFSRRLITRVAPQRPASPEFEEELQTDISESVVLHQVGAWMQGVTKMATQENTNPAFTSSPESIPPAHEMALKSAEGYVNEGAVSLDMETRNGGDGDKKFTSDEDKILEVLREVVRKCTNSDPAKRPTAAEVLELLNKCPVSVK